MLRLLPGILLFQFLPSKFMYFHPPSLPVPLPAQKVIWTVDNVFAVWWVLCRNDVTFAIDRVFSIWIIVTCPWKTPRPDMQLCRFHLTQPLSKILFSMPDAKRCLALATSLSGISTATTGYLLWSCQSNIWDMENTSERDISQVKDLTTG